LKLTLNKRQQRAEPDNDEATETPAEQSENQKLIESAKSFDELIKIIENNNISITRSNGTKEDTKYLVKLINDIKKDITFFEYEATKRLFTRTDGLRDKVQSLINQEKTGQSENQELNEESKIRKNLKIMKLVLPPILCQNKKL
jgi:phage terminase large subunit-like protein